MRRLLVALVALAAAAIVSVTWWRTGTRFESTAGSTTADNGEPAGGIPPADTGPAMASSAMRNVTAGASVAESRHDAARAQAMRITQVGHDRLLGRYQGEKVDGGWAAVREQDLIAHSVSPQIVALKVQPRNFSAHCRSATCRISADFSTQSDAGDWFTLFLTNPGTNLSNASFQTTPNPDGSAHAEIYGLAR